MSRFFAIFAIVAVLLRFGLWYALPDIGKFAGTHVKIYATVRADVLAVRSVHWYGRDLKMRGKIWPPRELQKELSDGDTLILHGFLVERNGFLSVEKPNLLAHKQSPYKLMIDLRRFIVSRIEMLFPEPAGSFINALLLGERSNMPLNMREDLRRTGLTHIVSISGMNIILIINVCASLLILVNPKYRWFCIIIIIIFFVLMTGARPPTVRAAVMGSFALMGSVCGRPLHRLRLLGTTIWFIIIVQPEMILDIGFQLSCAATAGIIRWTTKITAWCERVPDIAGLRQAIAVSFSAQAATFPILFFYFGTISMISPIANLALAPLITPIFFGGSLSIIFGEIAAIPTLLLTKIFFWGVQFFAGVPGAFFETGISYT